MDHQAFAQLLGNYGEFIGSIAVFATLFYVAVQVRLNRDAVDANTRSLDENRRVALAQAYQARSDEFQSSSIAMALSPDTATLWIKFIDGGMDALNPEEAFRMRQFMIAQASRLDNIHYQHELGLIDDDFYESTFKETVRDQGTFLKRVGVLQTRRASLVAAVDRILAEGNTDGGF